MRAGCRHLCLLMLTVACVSSVQADALYRWTDSDGQMHFGDRPPPDPAQQVEQVQLPSFAPPNRSVEDDPYSILNQVERLQVWRQDLARERREKREINLRERELEARQAPPAYPPSGPRYGISRPVFPVPPIHHPGWPGHHPRPPGIWEPDHPAYRPPMHPHPPVAVPYPARGGAVVITPR